MQDLESYNKVMLTILSNPFDPNDRIDYFEDYIPANTIQDYIAEKKLLVREDVDLVYSLSGKVIENDDLNIVCPNPADHIVIVPIPHGGGDNKNPARTIAMIIVMIITIIITYGAASGWWGAYWGGAGALSFQGALLAAGVMTAGSLLVNALFPISSPSLPALPGVGMATVGGGVAALDQTDTYGWGEMRNSATQGACIPRIYGTRRIAGNIISRYIEVQNNDEYLNTLIALHDGNIQTVQNIQINGQDIYNYNDVWFRITTGTRSQKTMEYFDDTFNHQTFNVEITDSDYTSKSTTGDSAEGLHFELICPYGLYYTNTQGGLDQTYVEVSIEYQKDGDVGWTSISAGQGGWVTYSDFVYTNWGFKFSSSADIIEWDMYLARDVVYRTGVHSTMNTGWIDLGKLPKGHNIISGLNGAIVEVAFKMDYDDFEPGMENRMYNIVRKVNLGGATGNVNIIGAQNKPLRRVYEVRNLTRGKYNVRLKKVGVAGSTSRYMNTIHLVVLSEIIPDDFAYPYVALLGVRALATSQLSGGAPSISAEVVRSHVPVYNINTSTWEAKKADNPAWASYDILVRPYYEIKVGNDESVYYLNVEGYDGVDPTSRIDYDSFSDWADWCDVLTDEGDKRATVNIVFDGQMNVWDALAQIAQTGRGMVIMRGTKFSCVVDKTTDPTQLFNVANIYQDSFKESFLSLEDRANIVEVSYFDSTRNYQRESIQVYGNSWKEGDQERRSNVTLYGCTTYNQAYREAVYRLNCNKYLTRTVEFDVDIDAIACQVGDVIRVQHNLPQWGYGGRVLDSDNNTITLDQEVTLDGTSTYIVYVRHNDDSIEQKTVTTSSTTTNKLTISGTWTSNPVSEELYTFGVQNSEYKSFKVIAITRSQDFKRTITAIEYNASMYTEGTPVSWNVSALKAIPTAYNIMLQERLKSEIAGTYVSEVHMTWSFYDTNEKRLTRWDIYRKDSTVDDNVWEYLGRTNQSSFVSTGTPWQYNHTYQVAICGVDLLADRAQSPDSGDVVKTDITILWKYAAPDDVDNFEATQDGTDLIFTWDHVTDIDRRGYEIRQGNSWPGGAVIVTEVSANKYTHKLTYDGVFKFWIKAIDTSGNYSANATSIIVTITTIASLLNIIYEKEELDDFISLIASSSNVTDNLIFVGSGNTVGLHVPHAMTDVGSGVSLWTDSGTSLTPYSGTTSLTGGYTSPARDIGAAAVSTLRLFKTYDTNALYVTDLTYPSRTDQTYPGDTDTNITDNSVLKTLYRSSTATPLTSLSWSTYAVPVISNFRYWQRKEVFTLDSVHTQLAYTSIYTTVDVPDKVYTFNSKNIDASGTTFNLSSDLGITMFVNYMVSCSVISNPYFYMIKNKTLTSFFVTLYDDSGTTQSGQIDMLIKGY